MLGHMWQLNEEGLPFGSPRPPGLNAGWLPCATLHPYHQRSIASVGAWWEEAREDRLLISAMSWGRVGADGASSRRGQQQACLSAARVSHVVFTAVKLPCPS